MNLLPTPEQQELVAAATRFLAAGRPASGSAAAGHQAGDETRWREMARLGWFAIGVPAADGGAGGSIADQALLFRELGRALVPGPLLGTVLGSALAIAGGREDLGRSLMAGETRAGLAEPWRDPSAGVSDVTGVTGSFRILDAEAGDLVSCLTPDGAALVAAGAVREVAHRLSAPDPSVPVSLARLDGIAPEVVVTGAEPASRLAAHGQVLVAALLVGILEAVRDMSVTYACTREQFGRPIGSFQAVKNRCADMAVRAEAAASLLFVTALTLEKTEAAVAAEGRRLAAAVKALASEYAVASAHDNVQNHGGMGFTEECPAHLYVKRALEWSVTLGSPDVLLADVAR